jgi:hypothetical protein
MRTLSAMLLMVAFAALLGMIAWHLEQREREMRLMAEALDTSKLLDKTLEERLREIERYRHDLAALLQELDYEQIRAAEEPDER